MILPADEEEGREELNEEGAGWVMGDLVGVDNGGEDEGDVCESEEGDEATCH